MKAPVSKLAEDVVRRTHPIADRVPGWFFRCEEQSSRVWQAEGTDLWGRTVSTTSHDYEAALDDAVQAADIINKQLSRDEGI
jgi:hypothetical protein